MSVHVFMTHISLMTGRTWIDRQTEGLVVGRRMDDRQLGSWAEMDEKSGRWMSEWVGW